MSILFSLFDSKFHSGFGLGLASLELETSWTEFHLNKVCSRVIFLVAKIVSLGTCVDNGVFGLFTILLFKLSDLLFLFVNFLLVSCLIFCEDYFDLNL